MKLTKYAQNPILKPYEGNEWESLVVCNPGAWYEDGKFYLLYRAAGRDEEHKIYLGLAVSDDGFNFKRVSAKPVLSPGYDSPDGGCVEDPRIVKFDNKYYVTYAYRPYPPGQYWKMKYGEVKQYNFDENAPLNLKKNMTNSGLLVSDDLLSYRRLGRITRPELDNRDVILFPEKINGKYVLLHRPVEWVGEEYGCSNPSIWLSYSDDLLAWEDKDSELLITGREEWEIKIGGSAPPLRTDAGWLTLYHGVDEKGVYRVGALLLDINNPSKIIARTSDFIMEPENSYETNGIYNNCVFPTGNVIVGETLYVYYGGADKYCAVATCSVTELIDFILSSS